MTPEATVIFSRSSALSQEEIRDADQVFELADLFRIVFASSSSSWRTGASSPSTSSAALAKNSLPET
jgi:hypothetical protein